MTTWTFPVAISARLPRVRVCEDLFLTFDPYCMETNPVADALQLIPLVLSKETVDVPALHIESGLSLRRFNPAIGLIISDDRPRACRWCMG